MNKRELIMEISVKTGLTQKQSGEALDALLSTVSEVLREGGQVQLYGFGTFFVKHREARLGRNPKTMEVLSLPETALPVFKPGKVLREAVEA